MALWLVAVTPIRFPAFNRETISRAPVAADGSTSTRPPWLATTTFSPTRQVEALPRAIALAIPAGESMKDHQVHERAWVSILSGEAEITTTAGGGAAVGGSSSTGTGGGVAGGCGGPLPDGGVRADRGVRAHERDADGGNYRHQAFSGHGVTSRCGGDRVRGLVGMSLPDDIDPWLHRGRDVVVRL